MNNIKDGGSAFPAVWINTGDENSVTPDGRVVPPNHIANIPGMSLRDWLAGMAMVGLLANPDNNIPPSDIKKFTNKYADAMLEARES